MTHLTMTMALGSLGLLVACAPEEQGSYGQRGPAVEAEVVPWEGGPAFEALKAEASAFEPFGSTYWSGDYSTGSTGEVDALVLHLGLGQRDLDYVEAMAFALDLREATLGEVLVEVALSEVEEDTWEGRLEDASMDGRIADLAGDWLVAVAARTADGTLSADLGSDGDGLADLSGCVARGISTSDAVLLRGWADPATDVVDVVSFDFWRGTRGLPQDLSKTGEENETGDLRWERDEEVALFGATRHHEVSYALRGWLSGEVAGSCSAAQL